MTTSVRPSGLLVHISQAHTPCLLGQRTYNTPVQGYEHVRPGAVIAHKHSRGASSAENSCEARRVSRWSALRMEPGSRADGAELRDHSSRLLAERHPAMAAVAPVPAGRRGAPRQWLTGLHAASIQQRPDRLLRVRPCGKPSMSAVASSWALAAAVQAMIAGVRQAMSQHAVCM